MTEDLALPPPANNTRAKRGGGLKWVFTLFLLTLLAVVTGAGFGLIITSRVEKQVEAKLKADSDKGVKPTPYTGDVAIQKLPAVVSNMSNSGNYWVRVESSIVYKKNPSTNPEIMAAEMRQDLLTYLRTVSVEQIQGPSGLLHLREDLNERAQLRSKGQIREFVIESLVVQ